MPEAIALVGFLVAQRLAELAWARRTESALRSAGAVEFGAWHYPLIVVLHVAWLVTCAGFGWRHSVDWTWGAVVIACAAGRWWCIATLGRRWSGRVLVIQGERLIRRGPYRWFSEPAYAVVLVEIIALPLALRLPVTAAVFGVLKAALLATRIATERAAHRRMEVV